MANLQKMLFDTDAGPANTALRRRVSVQPGYPVRFSAAGLAPGECVPLFVYVGSISGLQDCGSCITEAPDFKWTPLMRCGVPVELCGDTMEHIEKLPGLYSVGDPSVALAFAGDVNITALELPKEYLDTPFGCPALVETPVDYETCAGPVEALVTSTVQAILPAGTVVYTRKCPGQFEFDPILLCDPLTDARIVVVVRYDETGIPTSTAYDLTGAVWPGVITALVKCPDVELESDPVTMCDSDDGVRVTFTRWIVKENGVPTGATYDVGIDGAMYVPAGVVSIGDCDSTCKPSVPAGVLTDWGI